jgi:CheY-specific phosphatase CheX
MRPEPAEFGTERLGSVEEPLVTAAAQVLETMFFSVVEEGPARPVETHEMVAGAQVRFLGAHGGWLQVVLPESVIRSMTCSFMGAGVTEETEERSTQVLGEFANMVCGATLSRLEPREIFRLETPRLCVSPPESRGGPDSWQAWRLITDCGWIDLYWCWEAAP